MSGDVYVFPMSPAQQRLWFLDQMDPGTTMFNIPVAFRIHGALDPGRVQRTLSAIVERHEVLRTTLTSLDGETVQVIHPSRSLDMPVADLSTLSAEMREPALLRELRAAAALPFNLARGPLFRPALWRLAPDDHALMLCMHHSISDGWSLGVLYREFAALWEADDAASPASLPPLPIQYADYAHWHRARMTSGELEPQRRYWLEQLAGHRGILRLPLDRPRPPGQTFNAGACEFRLPERLADTLRAFSQDAGVTMFMSCITAYAVLLARYSGQSDLLIGIPAAGRTWAELEPLIGFFVNGLVLRFRIEPSASVREVMAETRRTVLDAFSNQDFSIDALMESLDFERQQAYEPLVQATFALQNFAPGDHRLSGLDVTPIQVECMHSRYDLMLLLTETPEGVSGNMIYNTDLFEHATVERMMQHLERVIEGMCAAPDAPLSSISFVTQAELYEQLALQPETYERALPLVAMQRDIYVDALANPGSLQNSVGLTFEIGEAIDPDIWGEAVQALTDAQPVMRTRIRPSSAPYLEPAYQCIRRTERAAVEVVDLSGEPLADREIEARLRSIIQRPYDPHGVLIRHFLVKVADGRWIAGIANHHLLLDGLSTVRAAAWIAAEYTRRSGGALTPEHLAPNLFHEFVPQAIAETDTQRVLSHWRAVLAGVSPLTCAVNAPARAAGPITRDLVIPAERWTEVRQFCRRRGITPQILMKCVFAIVADAHCRSDGDLAIQEFLTGRGPGHAAALGCYYQGLPFVVPRGRLAGDATCGELFEYVRSWQKSTPAYAGISLFEQRRLAPAGRVSLMFNFITAKLTIPVGHGVADARRLTPYADGFAQFEISTIGDHVHMSLVYDPAIFAEHAFLDRVTSVMDQILAGTERLADLSLLLPDERQAPAVDVPAGEYVSIPDRFARQAARTPDAPAIVQGDTTVSYAGLSADVTRIARALRRDGIGPGDLVGVCMERSPAMIAAVLAVLRTGAAYVPMDASYPDGRLKHMATDADCRVILTQRCLLDRFNGLDCRLMPLDAPDRDGSTDAIAESDTPMPARRPDSTFYVLYTSGSTGAPKGAAVTDLGEWNLINWYAGEFGIGPADRLLVISAFGFDLTQKNFFAALVSGAALVLPDGADFDPGTILDALARHRATIVNCAPGAFYSLLDDPSRFAQLATLRHLFLGGEPIRVSTMEKWIRSPHCHAEIVNSYGPTECTDVVCFHRLAEPLGYLDREVPLGSPLAFVQLHIVDDLGRPLPPYAVGHLCISGVCVGTGYWRNDALTAEAFVENPFGQGLMYRTGDLAYRLPDGVPVYVGRSDFQVKVRGLRIELGEIEAALAETMETSDWLVLASNDTLVACVRTDGPAPSPAEFRDRLGSRLPDYMIPQAIVAVPSWPLNPNGKVDREALARMRPAGGGRVSSPPRTGTELRLARMWREVIDRADIGREESFFSIGGHSLLAARAVARIRSEFGIDLPLRVFFEAPTIAAMGSHIDGLLTAGGPEEDPELLEALAGLSEQELDRLLLDEN